MFGSKTFTALGVYAMATLATAMPAALPYAAPRGPGGQPHGGHHPSGPPHSNATSTYPSKAEINTIFGALHSGSFTKFASYVDTNVVWTVEGTHPLAGTFHGSDDFFKNTLEVLGSIQSTANPIVISVVNIIGGGDEEWSVQELHAQGIMKNGFDFDNNYSWVTRWSPGPNYKIVEARAYLDTELVKQAVDSNIKPAPQDYKYSDDR
ncbi:MAG: hypothetical protein M1828_004217 [Chrysothrix sp. TS-e1954]|nr:MAG: hypothetical protein M1828_004217 [Chrysothrix sp. TS-e1954]